MTIAASMDAPRLALPSHVEGRLVPEGREGGKWVIGATNDFLKDRR